MTMTRKGFTALPNELLEKLCASYFSPNEWKIILTVIRFTIGYNRKSTALSINSIANRTGIDKTAVSKCLKRLIGQSVITEYASPSKNSARTLGINTCYAERQSNTGVDKTYNREVDKACNSEVDKACNSEVDKACNPINKDININNKNNNIYTEDGDVREVVDRFNSVCTRLTRVEKISVGLSQRVKALLETFSLSDIEKGFYTAQRSPFLRGERGDWRASFEWLCDPENMTKILSGKYETDEESKYPFDPDEFLRIAVMHSKRKNSNA